MKRWIATITNSDWGLIEEQEFVGGADVTEAFYQFGWIKPYDDTKPMPPKGINEYEAGKVYPPSRFIINGAVLYKSNTTTSATWVPAEWDVKL